VDRHGRFLFVITWWLWWRVVNISDWIAYTDETRIAETKIRF